METDGNGGGWHTLVALVPGLALRACLGVILALVLIAGATNGEATNGAEVAVRCGAHAVATDLAHLSDHMLPRIICTHTQTNQDPKKHIQFNPRANKPRTKTLLLLLYSQPSPPEMCATHRGGVAVHGMPIRAIHEFINAGPPPTHRIPWLPLPRAGASSPSGSHANGRPPYWESAVRLRPDSLLVLLHPPRPVVVEARRVMSSGSGPKKAL
jgi:hypothetical protein